ncbi:MAG TPA: hypothetical protein VG165_09890 [Solirubrobacteraceae bacterium]|nr:hypothetical protein [Solirubrobacteraceae bacterium]
MSRGRPGSVDCAIGVAASNTPPAATALPGSASSGIRDAIKVSWVNPPVPAAAVTGAIDNF